MVMWKVAVAPIEDENAWDHFAEEGVIAIGWCDDGPDYENDPSVELFGHMAVDDYVVAHLPKKRSGISFLTVGVGRVTSSCIKRDMCGSAAWAGTFRRQCAVDWLSKRHIRLPDILSQCNYRRTVCQLDPALEKAVLRRYDLLR